MPIRNLQAKSAEALFGHVNHVYGRLKTVEESEFTNSLTAKFTRKLVPVFLMTLWVGVVSHSNVFMIVFQHPKISRCVVHELEGHFSYEQILNLTVRDQNSEYGQYCHYDRRDYKQYIDTHGYNYTALMSAISDAPNAIAQPCPHNLVKKIKEEFDDIGGEVENSHDFLQLYCQPESVKRMSDIALKYGQFLLSVPVGLVGDFYGRKMSVFFGGGLFTFGIFLTNIPHVIPVIFGRFLIGTSMILFYTVFVIFIESTSSGGRRKVALLLHEGIALGRLLEYVMYITIKNLRYITYINTGMCVTMVILVFFINDSPRWLYFSGDQRKAYKILGEDRPDAPSTLKRRRLWPHFKKFSMPVFRKRLMIQMITVWCTSSVTFLIRSKFSKGITHFLVKELLDSGMMMGSCIVLTFVLMSVIGRGRTIMTYFTVTSCLSAMLFFNPRMNKLIIDLFLSITVTLTENATFFAFYMISEFYPTDFRFTGYGLCCGIHGFGDIFHFHVASYRIPFRSLFYAPLFVIANISLVSSHFQVDTSGPFRLADYPREAMRESDFKEIMKNMMYEQSRMMLSEK